MAHGTRFHGDDKGGGAAQRLAYEGLHEIFARLFEGYLRNGKAPSRRLNKAFRMFKRWLSAILSKTDLPQSTAGSVRLKITQVQSVLS